MDPSPVAPEGGDISDYIEIEPGTPGADLEMAEETCPSCMERYN